MFSCLAVLGLAVLLQTPRTETAPATPERPFQPLVETRRIDPQFDKILAASQTVLSQAKSFSVTVEMTTKSNVAGAAAPRHGRDPRDPGPAARHGCH